MAEDDYGVTPEGFILKRLTAIRQDIVDLLNEVVDESTGEKLIVDLSDSDDPLVQVVDSFSDGLSVGWEQLQFTYNQFDPLKSSGAGLSGVVQLNGLRRKAGTFSETPVIVVGRPNLLLPVGQQITDMEDTYIWTLSQVLLNDQGAGTGTAICFTKGPNEAPANTLVKILTPIAGWDRVTNGADAVVGTLEETDTELRARQQVSTAATGAAIVDALFSTLRALPDVTFARVYENKNLETDHRTIPGKTVAVVIVGGDDQEISDAIFLKQCIGMSTYGTTVTEQRDLQGMRYAIFFTRPPGILMWVRVEVRIVNSDIWTDDGPDRIRQAILSYAAGNTSPLGVGLPLDTDGYAPGDDVYASELYVPVNTVRGTQILSLLVGIVGGECGQLVEIDWNRIAEFKYQNIHVSIIEMST